MRSQELSEMGMEHFDPHGFGRNLDLTMTILAGPTGGLAQEEPVGGFISGGGKTFGLDKAFDEPNRMAVAALPILGELTGGLSQ